MGDELDSLEVHPPGDLEWLGGGPAGESHLETYGGRVHVEWDPSAKVTAFGPLSYFIHFLKTSGLWDEWVELCPLPSPEHGSVFRSANCASSHLCSFVITGSLFSL